MKVSLETFGGLAAGIRRPAKVVEADQLSSADAHQLNELVEAVRASGQAVTPGQESLRDAMTYKITIQDGARTDVVKHSGADMPAAFETLQQWIERHVGK